jgi:DNA mismatch repair protein MutL
MAAQPEIQVLDPLVAQKIAAGEVIERPSGVIRELLDNSLDADAHSIEVHITAGGNDELRVLDDGTGMSKDDLARCYLAHATSKIRTVEDLDRVRSLGFRGEALSAVASVSRLSITSALAGEQAHELRVEAGRQLGISPAAGSSGTSVTVRDLFFNVPARRKFLKRGASESASVRSLFLDKALPFPDVSFRLFSNGELRSFLPSATLIERISAAYPERTEPARLQELRATGDGFSLRIIAGEPAYHRRDRKQLQVFVNQRRIWEYALVQAVEYAYRDYLHGGLYPTAYLFITIEPELVDFNIHPAKREVRFRNLPQIHRRVVTALSKFLSAFDNRAVVAERDFPLLHNGSPLSGLPAERSSVPFDLNTRFSPQRPSISEPRDGGFEAADTPGHTALVGQALSESEGSLPQPRYLGQIMNLFLVVEVDQTLYLVDQHAAHERVIYDRLRSGSGGQELLFPVALELEPQDADELERRLPMLARLGIVVEKSAEGWELASVPAMLSLGPEEIAVLLMDLLHRPNDFERELFASLSCRSAVMDGDQVSPDRALEIIQGVIGLRNARCPHGRPVWISFSKEQLAGLVGRT